MKKKVINLSQTTGTFRRIMLTSLFFSVAVVGINAVPLTDTKEQTSERVLQDNKLTVQGTVTDATGESLIGVSVIVKGTTVGTTTDIDGRFTLTVPDANSVLSFSYLGYTTQEVTVGARTTFDIVLKDDSQLLDQVVVTALGMKREEKSLGYSVTELKGDDLNSNVINPVSALQGKVAGVEIAGTDGGLFGSTKIQIRGASTLKGNNQPIYVVDGVILDNGLQAEANADFNINASDFGNELKNLNPDDFESVSILKGAPATALYGSRGLNGAVVITTKGGGANKGFGVSVTQSLGFDKVTSTPKHQKLYGIGAMSGYVDYGEQNPDGTFKRWDNANQFQLNSDGFPSLKVDEWGMYWGPRYDGRSIELYDGTTGSYVPYKNNYKDAFRTAFNSNTNVVVKGGNDKVTYYSSLSYRYAEGTLDRTSFNRLSYMLKGSYKISDRVDVAASVTLASSRPKNPQPNIGQNFATVWGPSYNTKYYRDKYTGDTHGGLANSSYGDRYAFVPGAGEWFNIYNRTDEQKELVVRPTIDVNVKIADWVSFKAEANMNYYNTRREWKWLGQGYLNQGTDNDEGGYYSLMHDEKRQETLAGTFTFNKNLGDFYLGGFVRGEYFNTEQSLTKNETDGGLIVPGQYFLDNTRNPYKAQAKIYGQKRMLSAIFAANLGWKNQLYVDITGRNDWSSALVYSDGTGNYSYFYPSVTTSWIITESFRNSLPAWISFAKIRASWAQVGNDTDPYTINFGYTNKNYMQASGSNIYTNIIPTQLPNRNLKPERKNAWEFGLDWRFLDNRIGIDATYYKENTKDQIIEISLPYESGVTSQWVNAGNIQNEGIELALKTIPFRNRDWEWTLDLTYTRNRNKIIELHPNVQNFITLEGYANEYNFRIASVAQVGGSYGLLMTDSKPMRNDNGDIVLQWSDANRYARQLRSGVIEPLGSLAPDFLGSVSTGLKYKDFSLHIGIDMRYGGLMASYNNRYGTAYGIMESSLKYRDEEHGGISWVSQYDDSKGMTFHDGVIPEGVFADGTTVTTPGGDKVDVSGISYKEAYEKGYVEPVHASAWTYWQNAWSSGVVNDNWVNEVKYIALREISLGYRVPKSFASKLGSQGMNLSFTARNLGYLYNSLPNKMNPESIRGNSSGAFRERSNVPVTSSFMFTVGLDF